MKTKILDAEQLSTLLTIADHYVRNRVDQGVSTVKENKRATTRGAKIRQELGFFKAIVGDAQKVLAMESSNKNILDKIK